MTEADWYAARAGIAVRKTKRGRTGRVVNLFAGLLRDARDGGPMQRVTSTHTATAAAYVSFNAIQGVPGSRYVSFPVDTFDAAILSLLREVDPRDVLPAADRTPDRVAALAGRLAELDGRIEKAKAALAGDADFDAMADVLRQLDADRKAVARDLDAARREAAAPLATAWGECRTLADTLAAAPDPHDARVRLRAALRRVVESVWCVFVGRGKRRVAVAQVWFAGGNHRDYLIGHRPAQGSAAFRRPAAWWARSFAAPTGDKPLDLRDPADVAKVDRFLTTVAVETLDAGAGDG